LSAVEVVITGLGVVSPIGIGKSAFWDALCAGQSGVGRITLFDASGLPVSIAAEVPDFDPKPYVRHRKSLKLMCRDAQLGVAAATLACRDAGVQVGQIDPDRLGVVLGADRICSPVLGSEPCYRACSVSGQFDFGLWGTRGMEASFPLTFLRVLPNMIASHVSIAEDARGPNNTIHQGDVSSLLAIQEAARVIQRGMADVMIAGGASSQMDPFDWVRHFTLDDLSHRQDDPAAASRPFDADRDGQVRGEGAAALILESRQHAEARRAGILARLLGWAAVCDYDRGNHEPPVTKALERAMTAALGHARLEPGGLGHLNAHGLSTVDGDRVEARALREVAPAVPVTALKSYFGNLGAAGGAVEAAASVLSLAHRAVPATLNYETPDPQCPLEVIHGQALEPAAPTALAVSWTRSGQAVAVVLGSPD